MSSVIRRWVLFGIIQNQAGRLKDSYVGDVGTNKIRLGSKLDLLKKHICETCGKKFRKIEELMQHEQVIHGKDLLYQCKQCNVGFTGMEQMRDHAKKYHSYNKMKEKKSKNDDNN